MSMLLFGFGMLLLYFIVYVSILFSIRRFFSKKSERFRKLLHLGVLCSIFVFLYAFKVWWHAVVASIVLSILILPVLQIAERFSGYSTLLVQRKPNEVKWSMIQMFFAFAIVISISKGVFDENYLAVSCLFTWGFGDAGAALIGKRFGKHKLKAKLIEGVKSVEGTVAMAVIAFLTSVIVLLYKGATPWYYSVLAAAAAGIVSSVVELYTLRGADTITCPLASLVVLSGILWLTGGLTPVWM